MEKQEYEIIMFHDNAIVDGSKIITSNKDLIKLNYEYAITHGYRFSSKKTKQ